MLFAAIGHGDYGYPRAALDILHEFSLAWT
jgi:hypothetical protein